MFFSKEKYNPSGLEESPSKRAVCGSYWARDCSHTKKGIEKTNKVYQAHIFLINLESVDIERTTLLGQLYWI